MAPDTHQTEQDVEDVVHDGPHFVDRLWTLDGKQVAAARAYFKQIHDDLDQVLDIYLARAELEQGFGEQLEQLASRFSSKLHEESKPTKQEDAAANRPGTQGALDAIYTELTKAGQSHTGLAKRLKGTVAQELQTWLTDQKLQADQTFPPSQALYDDLKDHIHQLYDLREKYQAMDRRDPECATIQNDYRLLLNEIDSLAKKTNQQWQEACVQMEVMEQQRLEFFSTNAWDYANLASARLMVQYDWCEMIRSRLEVCTFENETELCLAQIGSFDCEPPATKDYVNYFFDQQSQNQTKEQQKQAPDHQPKPTPQPPAQDIAPVKPAPSKPDQALPRKKDLPPKPTHSIKRKPIGTERTLSKPKDSAKPAADSVRTTSATKRSTGPASAHTELSEILSKFTTHKAERQQLEDERQLEKVREREKERKREKDRQREKDRERLQRQQLLQDNNRSNSTRPPSPPSTSPSVNNSPLSSTPPPMSAAATALEPVHNNTQVIEPHTPTTITSTIGMAAPQVTMAPKSPRPAAQQLSGQQDHRYPTPINTNFHAPASPMIPPPQPYPASPMMHPHLPFAHQAPASPLLPPSTTNPLYSPQHSPNLPPSSPMGIHPGYHPPQMSASRSPSPYLAHPSPAPGYASRPCSPMAGFASRPCSPMAPLSPSIQHQPAVTHAPDQRPILFWCRSIHNYDANLEEHEIPFRSGTDFAVVYQREDGWWQAFKCERGQLLQPAGYIPSNFMTQI
ncbi:hypothetical protein DM01DRAFT_1382885 [Hesseltinella vesiculosa]|uniref:SH3 domain-containing protein n=1 Tax=Hesseltinella vesiculosa TaxID=101127 RepID=A0A1X2GKK6_9FUNG|nr:hypothetical protein DM01DRAFT_1382885 [Hesseltinella vesiculosa]